MVPQRPPTTNPAIVETTTDTERRKIVAEWAQRAEQYERFDAYETVFKEKLEAAFDSHYFQTLCNDLLEYTHMCVSKMLDHPLNQCLAITDTEKALISSSPFHGFNAASNFSAFSVSVIARH